MASDPSSARQGDRFFFLCAWLCLVVLSGLYLEEAIHFYHFRGGLTSIRIGSPECHPLAADADRAMCSISGYGSALFQRSARYFVLIDPSAPQQSTAELDEQIRVYEEMFAVPEDQRQTRQP